MSWGFAMALCLMGVPCPPSERIWVVSPHAYPTLRECDQRARAHLDYLRSRPGWTRTQAVVLLCSSGEGGLWPPGRFDPGYGLHQFSVVPQGQSAVPGSTPVPLLGPHSNPP